VRPFVEDDGSGFDPAIADLPHTTHLAFGGVSP
jgi:hypothetical protein